MSEAVVQRIEKEIRRRIGNYVAERMGDGTVGVSRPGRFVRKDDTVVIQKASDRSVPTLDIPGNPPGVAFEAVFNLNCFIGDMQDESVFSEACDEAAAEIIHTVTHPTLNAATWFKFDGLAIRAWFGSKKDLPTDTGKKGGVSLPLSVVYRVAENDHTTVR